MSARTHARVLIVDDSSAEREALEDLLGSVGFSVSSSANGEEALRALRQRERPDVILLDLVMPTLNGWEFRVAQRADAALAQIPVIAVTGERSAEAEAIDAEAVLHKPLSRDSLLAAIQRVLDSTATKRLEQTERMAALGRLAASIAHEVNNPLAFAKSNLSYVHRELFDSLREGRRVAADRVAEYEQALIEAEEGLHRIELIVKDILLFGRNTEGQARDVCVVEPVQLALKVAAGRLNGVVLETDLDGDLRARVDPSRLAQVILNLVVNATDALQDRPAPERCLRVTAKQRGEHAEIMIADSGPGIPPQILGRIFEPFFTTKPPGLGTGLGLFVCRGLVDSMNGKLDLDTEVGRGTTVRVTLPRLP